MKAFEFNSGVFESTTLLSLGYTNIVELKIGINGWKNADKPGFMVNNPVFVLPKNTALSPIPVTFFGTI